MTFPGPQTWAEGQRGVMSWLVAAAGMFCGAASIGLVLIVWLGGWTPDTQAQRITVLSLGLVGFLAGTLAVIISLAVGGPVGRFKAGVSRDGATFEASDDDKGGAA